MATALFMAAVALFCAGPLYPVSDFWWHIGTGRWIVEAGQIPASDPFSYTAWDSAGPRAELILQGYWLIQAGYALLYQLAGYWGLVIFKSATFVAILATLWGYGRRLFGAGSAHFVLLLPALFYSYSYLEVRPQVWSFLGVILVLVALEGWRMAAARGRAHAVGRLLPIPLIVLIWANIHPGFILAPLLMAIYLVDTLRELLRRRRGEPDAGGIHRGHLVQIGLLLAVTLLVSFANPATWRAYQVLLGGALFAERVTGFVAEYQPTLSYFQQQGHELIAWSIPLLAVPTGVCLLRCRAHLALRHWLLLAGFAAAGLLSYRYFYLLVLVVTLLLLIALAGPPRPWPRRIPGGLALLLAVVALSAGLYQAWPVFAAGPVAPNPAARAIRFALDKELPQPVFHPYDWGGNLIWMSGGRYRTFLDARTLNPAIYPAYRKAKNGEKSAVFARYGINTVMFYVNPPNNTPVPGLIYSLLGDRDWRLVLADSYSCIFVRKGLRPDLPAIDKTRYMRRFADYLQKELAAGRNIHKNSLSLAQFYYYLAQAERARALFRKILERRPDDRFARAWLDYLGG